MPRQRTPADAPAPAENTTPAADAAPESPATPETASAGSVTAAGQLVTATTGDLSPVAARVIRAFGEHAVNDVVELPALEAITAVRDGWADTAEAAVAYARSLKTEA